MKRKNHILKKMIIGCLAAVMIMSGMNVYAAVEVQNTVSYEAYKAEVFAEAFTTKVAPVKDGYFFGGWYKDADGTEAIYATDNIENISGTVYAKFVPAYVLSVKAQNYYGTAYTDGQDSTSTRLCSSVDNARYSEIGFKFSVAGGAEYTYPIENNMVYNKLSVKAKNNEVTKYEANKIFGESAKHFSVLTIEDIPESYWCKEMYVRPYWVTPDGTTVEGIGKYVFVDDGINNYISVPINLNSVEAVAAGLMTIDYDETKLTYIGYNTGIVFEDMKAHNTGSTVQCVGNVNELANVAADDLYISLRFEMKNPNLIGSGEFLTFEVSDENFCNVNEDLIKMNVWNVQY